MECYPSDGDCKGRGASLLYPMLAGVKGLGLRIHLLVGEEITSSRAGAYGLNYWRCQHGRVTDAGRMRWAQACVSCTH